MKKVIPIAIAAALILIAFQVFNNFDKNNNSNKNIDEVVLRDAHGLSVDRSDSSKVYIATHSGLLMMKNDNKILQRVGTAQDDYMGFSAHPSDSNIFYTSGHPSSGGNLGVQKSIDGGQTWKKISDGVDGPVDFHAMAISQADPSTLYGISQGQIQRSDNDGKDWVSLSNGLPDAYALAISPQTKEEVFGATSTGIFISRDGGLTWLKSGLEDTTSALTFVPNDDQKLLAYSVTQGFVNSSDAGKTWSKFGDYQGPPILHIAYDFKNPQNIYAVNQSLEIYKSSDGGINWKKIREGTQPSYG